MCTHTLAPGAMVKACSLSSLLLSSPQVQSKVNLKYDYWHKEIVGRFGSLLGQNMQDFYTVVSKVSPLSSPSLWSHSTCLLHFLPFPVSHRSGESLG